MLLSMGILLRCVSTRQVWSGLTSIFFKASAFFRKVLSPLLKVGVFTLHDLTPRLNLRL